jgi:hypothetical protein
MKVWPRNSACCTDEPNFLSAGDRVSFRYQRATQMKVPGDDSIAVIDVNHVPGEKESVYKSNDSTIGCHDRRSSGSTKIHTQVSR